MNNSLKSRLRNSWFRVFGFFLVDTINNLKVKVLKRDLVLIYQMGKVASSSIYNSLKDKKNVTYQIHRFDEDYIKEVNDFNKNKSGFSESKIVDERSVRIKKLFLKKPSKPIFLISLVRDPIERNVSAFFQNKNHLAKNYSYANTQDLIELFYNLYAHETPLIWFDKEFKKTTGVDVYDFPFNKKQKHTILIMIHHGNLKLKSLQMLLLIIKQLNMVRLMRLKVMRMIQKIYKNDKKVLKI